MRRRIDIIPFLVSGELRYIVRYKMMFRWRYVLENGFIRVYRDYRTALIEAMIA